MLFYSPVTVTFNLLNVVWSLLMICSLKSPDSVVLMFLIVSSPFVLFRSSRSLNRSPVLIFPDSLLTTRRFSGPNVHSIRSSAWTSAVDRRRTERPSFTDTDFTSCQNNRETEKYRKTSDWWICLHFQYHIQKKVMANAVNYTVNHLGPRYIF